MALLFLDSFDHYQNILSKWTEAFFPHIDITHGRNGRGLGFIGSGTVGKTTPARGVFIVGFACRITLGGSGFQGTLYQLNSLGNTGGLLPLYNLNVGGDGTLIMFAGTAFALIDNPTGFVCTSGAWMFIEQKISLSGGGGGITVACDLKVNGDAISKNKNAVANFKTTDLLSDRPEGHYHQLGSGNGSTGGTDFDDFYILDNTGEVNNDFIGDVKIGVIYPRQDATHQWTPFNGSQGYTQVNEHPPTDPAPDDDATYIFDDKAGDISTFFFDQVSSLTGQILAVQFNIYARKDDEGSKVIVDTSNGGGYVGPEANWFYLGDTYYYHTFPYDGINGGNLGWTPDAINATDFGVKIIDNNG